MLGDIVGAAGRLAVAQCLPTLRQRWRPHLVIANAENAANGSGLTPQLYQKLCDAGLDGMTLGDHVYHKKQIVATLEKQSNILRPANLPAGAKGKTWMRLVSRQGEDTPGVYVLTVLGRLFMNLPANDPFETVESVISSLPEKDPIVVVEVHAEATSEKCALGRYLDGRATAVWGTHTHVPTADGRVLPNGTAFITDIGMVGAAESIIGRDISAVLRRFTTGLPARLKVIDDDIVLNGAVVDFDANTGKATGIQRVERRTGMTL